MFVPVQTGRAIRFITLIILTSLLTGLFPLSACGAPQTPVTLVIMHTNDIHGHLKPHIYKKISKTRKTGGMANVAAMVNQIRRQHPDSTILLDAGDIAQGTPISNINRGLPVVEIMNAMKYDAMAIGNHEFDWGMAPLMGMIRAARFPVLSANVKVKTKSGWGNTGGLIKDVKPYVIKTVSGIPVGILGITTRNTPYITSREKVKDLTFKNPLPVVKKYIPLMKRDGAKLIVILSHQGYPADLKLAVAIPEIDLIVGGHGHSVIRNPGRAGNALIVQAGSYGRYLGKLTIQVNPATGRILPGSHRNELIDIFDGEITPDPKVLAMIEKYESRIRDRMSRVINKTPVDLTRQSGRRWGDSNLGNAVCDSYLFATGAQVSIYNPGGIRQDIYQGPITIDQIYQVLPFDDQLIIMKIPGRGLQKVLEHGAGHYGSAQVSGVTFQIDYNKPRGSRVSGVKVGGVPLNPDRIYVLATVDFLYNGGDRFKFPGAGEVRRGPYSRDVFIDYIQQVENFDRFCQGRIKITKANKASKTDNSHQTSNQTNKKGNR